MAEAIHWSGILEDQDIGMALKKAVYPVMANRSSSKQCCFIGNQEMARWLLALCLLIDLTNKFYLLFWGQEPVLHVGNFPGLSLDSVPPPERCIHKTILFGNCLVGNSTRIVVRIQFFNRFVNWVHGRGVIARQS